MMREALEFLVMWACSMICYAGIAWVMDEYTIIRMAHRVFISGWAGEPGGTRRIRRKTKILQAELAVMKAEKLYLFWNLLQSGEIKIRWNVK